MCYMHCVARGGGRQILTVVPQVFIILLFKLSYRYRLCQLFLQTLLTIGFSDNHANSNFMTITMLMLRRWHTLKKLTPETCTGNLHEKFDASSSQFFTPKQLSSQSRCMVHVMCQTVSVLEYSCILLRARNLYQKKFVPDWLIQCQFLVQDDLHKFPVQVSWVCVAGIINLLSVVSAVVNVESKMHYQDANENHKQDDADDNDGNQHNVVVVGVILQEHVVPTTVNQSTHQ